MTLWQRLRDWWSGGTSYTPPPAPVRPRPPRIEKDFYGNDRVVETDAFGQRVYRQTTLRDSNLGRRIESVNPYYAQRAQEQRLQESMGRLTIHHLSYQHHGDELNHQEDLITLCQSCHSADHSAKPWLTPPKPYPTYYTEFVSSPYWHEVRKQVLKRDGYRCRGCGSNGEPREQEPTFTMPRSRRGAMNQLIRMMEQG